MKVEIDTRALKMMAQPGIGWVRVFGRGFTWKDTRRHPLLFSERNGIHRRLALGSWSFRWLGREVPALAAGDTVKVGGTRDGLHDGVFVASSVQPSFLSLAPPLRTIKIAPRTFYYWATLALSVELMLALGCKAWLLAYGVAALYGAAYLRSLWWARRLANPVTWDPGPYWPPRPAPLPPCPPPEPRRVHSLCMLCQQDCWTDPMATNAGICEACAGGPA